MSCWRNQTIRDEDLLAASVGTTRFQELAGGSMEEGGEQGMMGATMKCLLREQAPLIAYTHFTLWVTVLAAYTLFI